MCMFIHILNTYIYGIKVFVCVFMKGSIYMYCIIIQDCHIVAVLYS